MRSAFWISRFPFVALKVSHFQESHTPWYLAEDTTQQNFSKLLDLEDT